MKTPGRFVSETGGPSQEQTSEGKNSPSFTPIIFAAEAEFCQPTTDRHEEKISKKCILFTIYTVIKGEQ